MVSHDFASLPKVASLQWKTVPDFVALPKTTEEVSRLVQLAFEAGLPIVPRGGGSGLVGGSVPNRGGILVDMRRMDRVESVDLERRTIVVQAGLSWKDTADVAAARGLFLSVAPQFSPASTIGGWYSSGGVGYGSFKYGSARDVVLDLEIVLPSGEIVRTADGTVDLGPTYANLSPAFFGAEGTLGLITRATLQLLPRPEEVRPLSYSFKDLWSAREVPQGLAASDLEPYHVSIWDPIHLALLRKVRSGTPDPQGLVDVTLEGPKDEVIASEKELDGFMTGLGGKKLGEDVARAQWAGRFDAYAARRISGGLVIAEAEIPVKRFPDALKAAALLMRRLRMQVAVNTFLVDRNTVSIVPYFLVNEGKLTAPTTFAFVKKFGDVAFELGGHPQGLGLLAAFNFPRMHRGAAGMYGAVKGVLDPHSVVNPGKTIETWTRYAVPVFNTVPPEVAGLGLEVAAFLRRLKPTADRYVDLGGAS
jgi:glycolate oxidase